MAPAGLGDQLDAHGCRAFADAAHGLVVGERTKGDDPEGAEFIGTILLRTSDGGVTWTRIRLRATAGPSS